jgi:PAS domain S-box-containing protein
MTNQNDSTDDAADIEWLASTILEAASASSIGIMVSRFEPELRFIYTTPSAEALFGRTTEELQRTDPFSFLAPEDRPLVERIVEEFMSTGTYPPTIEATVVRPDDTRVTLDVGVGRMDLVGSPAIVAFMADMTQPKSALESLKRSEQRFRSLVESIPEAIFVTEGTAVTYANPAFEHALGIERGAIASGLDVLDLVHDDDAPRLLRQIGDLAAGPVAHAEYRMRTRDESWIMLEVSAISAEFDGKLSVLWLGRDVTRRKEVESQLLQADRLAVLGTLSAGMAHAINNPLLYTLLNLEHVARRLRQLGSQRDYQGEARVRLAEAHDGAERVAKVVRQMRGLSRARASEPRPVDLRAVLENVLAMVGNEIRHRGQLVTRSEPVPRVWATESELEQALLGLIVYVARSLPDEVGEGREICLSTSTDAAGNAVVVVSDNGPALDPDTKAHLFDPFGTEKASGLGLAMCHAILTSLDGSIDVESGPVRGTTFRVVLPPASVAESERRPRPRSVPPPPLEVAEPRRARVLVIDDDPGVANTLRAMLEAHHEVKSVESGREALKILMGDEEFDIVFCDLVMPELSGIDLYYALELNRPQKASRVVFMTGGVFTAEAQRFLAEVKNRRIEKPFSLARVEQLLAEAVEPYEASATDVA